MVTVSGMLEHKIDKLLSGLILAGGEGRRMDGRDKGLISLADKPLVEYAIECLQPLVDDLSISCNRNRELYEGYQLDCIADEKTDNGFQGPMAGLVSGLKNAKHEWLLVMPCDTPLMTTAVMSQLVSCIKVSGPSQEMQAIIFSHQGLQPLHGLYHRSMLPVFEQCLAENKNALQRLLRSMPKVSMHQALDSGYSFNNANDPEELATIEALLGNA
ncbi:MAG: molybdenum cofactor guanylyltransferase [Oleispira sp.]|nr:molybdenum cofactor guanylyltransferase [Oleispira sp.]